MRVFAYWVARAFPALDAISQAGLIALLMFHPDALRSFGASLLLLLIVPFSQTLLHRSGVYDSHRIEGTGNAIRAILRAQLGAFFALAIVASFVQVRAVPRLALFFAASTGLLVTERTSIYFVLGAFRRRGYDSRNVCIVGSRARAAELADKFQKHRQWGLRVVCSCPPETERQFWDFHTGEVIGTDLETVLKSRVIDEILIAVPPSSLAQIDSLVRLCERYGLIARVLLEPMGQSHVPRVESFHGATTVAMGYSKRNERSLVLKRAFDIMLSALALLILSPVFLVVALAAKLSSPGPVFFVQTRVGLNGRKFQIYKFRTMVDGADSMVRHAHRSITSGPIRSKTTNDYRVTEIGRVLRRFSLDELPQLFNVLKGEMSLVGPRPLPVCEAEQISGDSRRRFSMPPGITCLWQVNGRSDVDFERWMQYDLQYVDEWSLTADAVLLARTIPTILTGKGAY
jgi:exopolysaccharide biosynthesis polyprenyl glycosylphosphotransferase